MHVYLANYLDYFTRIHHYSGHSIMTKGLEKYPTCSKINKEVDDILNTPAFESLFLSQTAWSGLNRRKFIRTAMNLLYH